MPSQNKHTEQVILSEGTSKGPPPSSRDSLVNKKEKNIQAGKIIDIEGYVKSGYEVIRDAFEENFILRGELGGACCIYQHGEKIVDLWGGIRNKMTGERWEEDTMVLVYSTTKGLSAMTLALAHSRGWLDYDEHVSLYWPEFAQKGKKTITVRQLLAHQAGLYAFNKPPDKELIADPDRLAVFLALQEPAWEPGSRQAYHAISLGFFEGELMRRIDPAHRTLGKFFQDEIANPLGLEFYIRLPESIPNSRLATLDENMFRMLSGFPFRLKMSAIYPRSKIIRALSGSQFPHDKDHIYARNLEIPSGGGVGTARAIAHAYSVFATDGNELNIRQKTLDELMAPAIPSSRGFYDECMKGDVQFSLGFMKSCPGWPFGSDGSFGSPGSGGSLGFADPKNGIGYGYVTNKMDTVTGDPRDIALRKALYRTIRQ